MKQEFFQSHQTINFLLNIFSQKKWKNIVHQTKLIISIQQIDININYLIPNQQYFILFFTFHNNLMENTTQLIYWQKQGADQLCGVHCVNSLLQGPFYDQVKLSKIALQLDQKQKQLMSEVGHETEDLKKYLQQESGNVGLYGNFSLQTLSQALKRIDPEISLVSIKILQIQIKKFVAFVCNSDYHWFCIKKINDIWYNLNSTNKKLPQIISEQEILDFFKEANEFGYNIFSVEKLKSNYKSVEELNHNQFRIDAIKIKKYQQERINKKKSKKINLNLYGFDQKQIRKAINQSLGKEMDVSSSSGDQQFDNLPKNSQNIQYKQVVVLNYDKFQLFKDLDMFFVFRESIEENFKNEPIEGIKIKFMMIKQKKEFTRKFDINSTVESVYDFIFLKVTEKFPEDVYYFYLKNNFNKQILADVGVPIPLIAHQKNQIEISICPINQ